MRSFKSHRLLRLRDGEWAGNDAEQRIGLKSIIGIARVVREQYDDIWLVCTVAARSCVPKNGEQATAHEESPLHYGETCCFTGEEHSNATEAFDVFSGTMSGFP